MIIMKKIKCNIVLSLYLSAMVLLFACNRQQQQEEDLEFTEEEEALLPVFLNEIPAEPVRLGLSSVVDDFGVLPLVSPRPVHASNPVIAFSSEHIFIGAPDSIGPERVLQFNLEGNLIREFSAPEHLFSREDARWLERVYYDPYSQRLILNWEGKGVYPQVYNLDGQWLYEVRTPGGFSDVYRLNDQVWFSTGAAAGLVESSKDFVVVVFYHRNGEVIGAVQRSTFPEQPGYTPPCWGPSVFEYKGETKLYMHGIDTIYRLVGMGLEPDMVLLPDEAMLPFNSQIEPGNLPGMYFPEVLAETSHHLFLNKGVIGQAMIDQDSMGLWSGSYEIHHQLVLYDKQQQLGKNVLLHDDLFCLIPEEVFQYGLLGWQGKLGFVLLRSSLVLNLIRGMDLSCLQDEEAVLAVTNLIHAGEADTPMIFWFRLKEHIDMGSLSTE